MTDSSSLLLTLDLSDPRDLRDMRLFLAYTRHRGFRSAGKAEGVSYQAVRRAVARVEANLRRRLEKAAVL